MRFTGKAGGGGGGGRGRGGRGAGPSSINTPGDGPLSHVILSSLVGRSVTVSDPPPGPGSPAIKLKKM